MYREEAMVMVMVMVTVIIFMIRVQLTSILHTVVALCKMTEMEMMMKTKKFLVVVRKCLFKLVLIVTIKSNNQLRQEA